MLAHVLAMAVGLVSFALYMAAFFFPEVYRKSDLTWSGIGLFYALVLWVCAGRITGGVLLGQTASVALLGWLSWQMVNLRRELAPTSLRTPLPGDTRTIAQAIQFKWAEVRSRWQQSPLAARTNRWAGTIAGWTAGMSRSVAKPKPPSIKARSVRPVAPIEANSVSVPIEPAIEPAIEPGIKSSESTPIATPAAPAAPPRPARPSRNLFGLRSPKSKSPSRSPKKPIVAPPPAPSLDELEDWDELEPEADTPTGAAAEASVPATVIEDVTVVIEVDAEANDWVAEAEAIEIIEAVMSDEAIAENDAAVIEAIEVQVIEPVMPEPVPEPLPEPLSEPQSEPVAQSEAAIEPPSVSPPEPPEDYSS